MQRHSQYAEKWINTKFGVPASTLTIGGYGCTITSIANLTENLTPLDINKMAKFNPQANLLWASINSPEIKFTWRQWTGDINIIKERLKKGEKAIVEIRHSTGRTMHWLAVVNQINGGFECIDPEKPQKNTIIKNNQITGSAFFQVSKNTNNNMKNYLEVNKKIIEDFTKHHSDVFGSRTADYIHLETKTPGAGIRERFNVLIKEIQRRKYEESYYELIQKELEKAKEENEILTGDIVNNINACNIDKADLNDKIQTLQELNGEWARDFDEELEKAKKEFKKNYIPEKLEVQGLPNWQRYAFDFLRNGSALIGSFFALDSVSSLIMNFVNEGNFDSDSLSKFGFGIVGLLLAYIQQEQKKNRKQNEKLEAINKIK
jgi:hypothetical protein